MLSCVTSPSRSAAAMRHWTFLTPFLLALLLLAASRIAQPPSPDSLKPKVFVIGLSKTGTTSIGDALSLLGYKRLGWKDVRSRHLVHTFINGDIASAIDHTKYYDAFEDLPWAHMYREVAELYPDSKFILSLRKNDETWLKSMHRHMDRGLWEPAAHFYGAHFVQGNEAVVLGAYRNHTASVRHFFADKPDRYAELVIDDGDANWQTLCRLAGCPEGSVPRVGFPRSNTAASWHEDSLVYLGQWIWGWIVTRTEEFASYSYYRRAWPTLNLLLEKAWNVLSLIDLVFSNLYFTLAIRNQAPLPMA